MKIERSSSQTQVEFANTSSIREQVFDSLQTSKEYRHAFIEESLRTRITAQIRALRGHMDYKQFANQINKKVSWVYRLEDPNVAPPTIPTLLEVSEALDIGLDVRFRRFSELLDDATTLNAESFIVPSFEEELRMGAFSQGKHRRKVRCNRHRRRPKSDIAGRLRPYEGEGKIGANKPAHARAA